MVGCAAAAGGRLRWWWAYIFVNLSLFTATPVPIPLNGPEFLRQQPAAAAESAFYFWANPFWRYLFPQHPGRRVGTHLFSETSSGVMMLLVSLSMITTNRNSVVSSIFRFFRLNQTFALKSNQHVCYTLAHHLPVRNWKRNRLLRLWSAPLIGHARLSLFGGRLSVLFIFATPYSASVQCGNQLCPTDGRFRDHVYFTKDLVVNFSPVLVSTRQAPSMD